MPTASAPSPTATEWPGSKIPTATCCRSRSTRRQRRVPEPCALSPALPRYIAMGGLRGVAVATQAARYRFGNHHGTMLAAGASEGQREIALALVDVVRQQEEQHVRYAVEKLPRLRKAHDVVLDLRVFAGQVPKLRHEVRVGKEPHIEDQIRVQRHAILVSETNRRDQQILAVALANKLVLDIRAQFVHVEFRRVDHHIRNR